MEKFIFEATQKFDDDQTQEYLCLRIKKQLQKIAEANEQQNLVELVSAFDDQSLQKLHSKSRSYVDSFFPSSDIIEKFKRFYESISDSVEQEKKDFQAKIPVSSLSIIHKSC